MTEIWTESVSLRPLRIFQSLRIWRGGSQIAGCIFSPMDTYQIHKVSLGSLEMILGPVKIVWVSHDFSN